VAEADGLVLDNLLRFESGGFPLSRVALDDPLQVIEVVQKNTFYFAYPWIDVAGHGDIDQHERSFVALAGNPLCLCVTQDVMWARGGTDDDVST